MRIFNYEKLKKIKWDTEIINLLTKIHEHKGKQNLFSKQKTVILKRLIEIAKIQSIEDSNKIEGIVTTSARIKDLISQKTTPKNRDEKEILGYKDVLDIINESFEYIPINSNHILQLHKYLYKYSEKAIGGKYKNTQNSIIEKHENGINIEIFKPSDPYETPNAIESICEELNKVLDRSEIDPLILIPVFIHDFLSIHPFNDGNGRMSRLLTTLLLYKQGYMVGKYISLESQIEKSKEKYYLSLRQSSSGWHDNNEDVLPFVKYTLRVILAAYISFEERMKYVDEKAPKKELVKNIINSKIGKFTKTEIMNLLPNVGKATIENTLKKLLEQNYIERFGKGRATFYVKKN
ncbi:Fic family protein [Mycoplasmopsis canis PG 14]|uniref:Protein involved in cell division n=1 Tax=Mycoplasmopsis canis TaxID=29555 RepID=A0A449AQ93_9BACT|nr:Fic family protein [Mycoplasmopsis canis]AMD81382.1 cell filamentation protein Fic [Mycoplasmopsis canis PG 14]EIE40858.1 Fic family protein [Mycoplasmopsis canis PG 14]VEU68637.1 Protein involved in cell division [Mycoplasmopsis canis]